MAPHNVFYSNGLPVGMHSFRSLVNRNNIVTIGLRRLVSVKRTVEVNLASYRDYAPQLAWIVYDFLNGTKTQDVTIGTSSIKFNFESVRLLGLKIPSKEIIPNIYTPVEKHKR